MEKTGKVRLFSAVTLFVSFLCIVVTFFIQIRMQKTVTDFADAANTMTTADTQTEEHFSSTVPANVPTTLTETPETAPNTPAAAPVDKADSATKAQGGAFSQTYTTAKTQKTTQKKTTTTKPETTTERSTEISPVLVVNLKTKKIHSPHCSYLTNTKPENTTQITSEELQSYLESGYTLCQRCRGYAE